MLWRKSHERHLGPWSPQGKSSRATAYLRSGRPRETYKDYSLLKGTLDVTHASLVKKIGAILGLSNPISTEIITDGVVLVAVDSVHGMLNGLAILGVKLLHFRELAVPM